jgi:eukaryotic-like serine/threonine-protein kinase
MDWEDGAERPGSQVGQRDTSPYIGHAAIAHPCAEVKGEYRLCFELANEEAAGVYLGMYAGEHNYQRPVLIKRMHEPLTRRVDAVERFYDEAQLAAMVSHPAVASVCDFGRSGDSYFLALDYFVGESMLRIAETLRRPAEQGDPMEKGDQRRLPYFAARIFADLAEGLHAIHEARDADGDLLGIVHRDATPANLFVLYDGSVRITNFAGASSRQRQSQTGQGIQVHKLAYMSPEQLAQEAVDRRSDIWTLGVVLWEFLTQTRLFDADDVATVVEAVQKGSIGRASTINRFVPSELDEVIARAIDRKLDRRYRTAREMALDLEEIMARRNEVVAASAVGDWLQGMFPGELAQRRALLRRAQVISKPPPAAS